MRMSPSDPMSVEKRRNHRVYGGFCRRMRRIGLTTLIDKSYIGDPFVIQAFTMNVFFLPQWGIKTLIGC